MIDNHGNSTVSPLRLNRRRLVQGAGLGLAAALPARMLSAADRKFAWKLWQEENPGASPATVEDYEPVALSAAEWATLTAIVDRIIPADDLGPGGAEIGAHIYIDRKLNGLYSNQLPDYQTGLAAIEASIDGGFTGADPDDQDDALRDAETGANEDIPDGFFDLVLEHTRQGVFCDPIHGGNREFMGWDLIGYPGIKLVWSEDDQALNPRIEPEHISVEKYGGQAE